MLYIKNTTDKQEIFIPRQVFDYEITSTVSNKTQVKDFRTDKNGTFEVRPDKGYTMSKVNVSVDVPVPTFKTEELTATENRVYVPKSDGYSKVTVDVPIPELPRLEERQYSEVSTNATIMIFPSEGYDAMKEAEIKVDVPEREIKTEIRTVDINENGQTIVRKGDLVDGMTEVTINTDVPMPKFTTEELSVTKNGVYTPTADGYSKVTVKVEGALPDGTVDFSVLGFTNDTSLLVNINKDIQYSKNIMDTWDASVIDMSNRFFGNSDLHYLPLIDTSKCTNFTSAFYNCANLSYVEALNTSSATTIRSLFEFCGVLTEVPALDTSKCTDFYRAFCQMEQLQRVKSLDTSIGTDLSELFGSDYDLLETPVLDVHSADKLNQAFYYCYALKTLKFRGGCKPTVDCTDMFNGTFGNNRGEGVTVYFEKKGNEDYTPILDALKLNDYYSNLKIEYVETLP